MGGGEVTDRKQRAETSLVCLKKVRKQLHPEQVGKKNATEHEPRRAGIIRTAGAQHATVDEWIHMMEEEEALQEQKKQEAEQRAQGTKSSREKCKTTVHCCI